jgi:KUP system potassium uptake protein
MLITTTLLFVVAQRRWGWSWLKAGAPAGLFFLVDIPFFCVNISKISHGAWFPLVIGAVLFTVILTWAKGRKILYDQLLKLSPSIDDFKKSIEVNHPQ